MGQNHSAALDLWSPSTVQAKWISESVEANYNLMLWLSLKGAISLFVLGEQRGWESQEKPREG